MISHGRHTVPRYSGWKALIYVMQKYMGLSQSNSECSRLISDKKCLQVACEHSIYLSMTIWEFSKLIPIQFAQYNIICEGKSFVDTKIEITVCIFSIPLLDNSEIIWRASLPVWPISWFLMDIVKAWIILLCLQQIQINYTNNACVSHRRMSIRYQSCNSKKPCCSPYNGISVCMDGPVV